MALADSHASSFAGDQTPLVIAMVGVLLILAIIGVTAVRAGRRVSGSSAGREVIVRCREGHLFTTIWIPFMSFKAIRLGSVRFQYCPVCDHATFVTIVPDSDLTPAERRIARQIHDRRGP